MAKRRVGLWLIGAFGSIGSTVALGIAALKAQRTSTTGLVTALPMFANLPLDEPSEFVIGGHDIRRSDFAAEAAQVGGIRPAFDASLISECGSDLRNWSRNVRTGWSSPTPMAIVQGFERDLRQFADDHQLQQTVVVNVATAEPSAAADPALYSLVELQRRLKADDSADLPVSSWYAYAAIAAGHPYVNFTASLGVDVPALFQFAKDRRVPVAGQDGKTGETLVKTTLAPMFAARNLQVLSWVGQNMLGNRDGMALSEPSVRADKVRNKDAVIAQILKYAPETMTGIDFVRSLDDWKTAWDHIHFRGFLNVPMTMQFTWQGCDSALAAPLVIDLARLVLFAQRNGESGALSHLAAFFKRPLACEEHDFFAQTNMLARYAEDAARHSQPK